MTQHAFDSPADLQAFVAKSRGADPGTAPDVYGRPAPSPDDEPQQMSPSQGPRLPDARAFPPLPDPFQGAPVERVDLDRGLAVFMGYEVGLTQAEVGELRLVLAEAVLRQLDEMKEEVRKSIPSAPKSGPSPRKRTSPGTTSPG